MTATLEHISRELFTSYSHLSDKEKIDTFLDQILEKKKAYVELVVTIKNLDTLVSRITWLDDLDAGNEIVIRGLLEMGKAANRYLVAFLADEKRKQASGDLFKEEFEALEEAIELHMESVLEVEHIIFELRKNKEFMDLCHSLDEF